jgi:hypothetical protein
MEAVHHDARRQVDEAQAAVFAAQRATQRAQENAVDQAAAEQRAIDEHVAAEQLRKDLSAARLEHRAELKQLRADHRNNRDQLRADTTAQLEKLRTARAAADVHAGAERLREELASVRVEHRAELKRQRADTAARLEELRAAHPAQLDALTAERTRSEPRPAASGPAAPAMADVAMSSHPTRLRSNPAPRTKGAPRVHDLRRSRPGPAPPAHRLLSPGATPGTYTQLDGISDQNFFGTATNGSTSSTGRLRLVFGETRSGALTRGEAAEFDTPCSALVRRRRCRPGRVPQPVRQAGRTHTPPRRPQDKHPTRDDPDRCVERRAEARHGAGNAAPEARSMRAHLKVITTVQEGVLVTRCECW